MKLISLRIDEEVLAKLKAKANKEDRSLNNFINRVLKQFTNGNS